MKNCPTLLILLFTSILCCTGFGKKDLASSPIKYSLVNANGGLTMRQQPSRTAKPIIILPDGEPVYVQTESAENQIIDGISGKWVQIKARDLEGWIFDGYLSKDSFVDSCLKKFSFESSNYNTKKWDVYHTCGIDRLAENAYIFYRHWWRDSEGEYLNEPSRAQHRSIMKDIRNDVKIIKIRENVALISRTGTALDYSNFTNNTDIWVFEDNFWHLFEKTYGGGTTTMFDANHDTLPDVLTKYGCCGNLRFKVFIGTPSGILTKIFETYFFDGIKHEVKYGKCENFQISGHNPELKKNQTFVFNCEINKMMLRK